MQWVALLEKQGHFTFQNINMGGVVKQRIFSAIVALSLVPSFAFGQEASGLSLGKPLKPRKPARTVGETYIEAQKGDWVLRCIATADGNDPCEMYQLIVTGDDTAIAELTIFSIPAGGPAVSGANFVVPLETLLSNPMELQFSEDVVKQYPYSYCTKVGCLVRIGFTADDIEALKKGDQAVMTINHMSAPDQPIAVPISLSGFTAIYSQLPPFRGH